MPRPQKILSSRRTKRVEIRLTEAEEKALSGLSDDCGLSISDFIRNRALASKPRIQKATPEREAFIKGLAHLGKVGSNLNQIAKAMNTSLATRRVFDVSPEVVKSAIYAVQTLSRNLLKHLTDGHQGQ